MSFPDKLLIEDENVVLVLRRHVRVLAGPFLLLIGVSTLAGVLVGIAPDGSYQGWVRTVVVVLALGVLLRWSVWPFLVWWNTVQAITDRRLLMREGVLSRTGRDMPLHRVEETSTTATVLDRMLGSGTLIVQTAGDAGPLELPCVPRVKVVQRTLMRLADQYADATVDDAVDDEAGPVDDLAGPDDDGRGRRGFLRRRERRP